MSVETETHRDGPLAVSSKRYGRDVAVVSLAGGLDRSNVATAERALRAAGRDHALLVVDLYELESLDRSGIALLVALSEARQGSDALRILPSRAPEVIEVLEARGIGSVVRTASQRRPLVA